VKRACRPGISAALAALLLVACGPFSGSSGEYRIATANVKTDIHMNARLDGVLNGRPNPDTTACLWVGQGHDAEALYWPFGYTAGGNPLTVYDDSGRIVATVGERVAFGGGLMGEDVGSILGCNGFTNFWVVGDVIGPQSN
jgi:hypothetical protein